MRDKIPVPKPRKEEPKKEEKKLPERTIPIPAK